VQGEMVQRFQANRLQLTIKKGSVKIYFDQIIKSANGHLIASKVHPISNNELQKISDTVMSTITETVKTSQIQPKKVTIDILHSKFRHTNKAHTKAIATICVCQWSGSWMVCNTCALEESKQIS
jgi:hypothetical protein